jgi:hypothetical protein
VYVCACSVHVSASRVPYGVIQCTRTSFAALAKTEINHPSHDRTQEHELGLLQTGSIRSLAVVATFTFGS